MWKPKGQQQQQQRVFYTCQCNYGCFCCVGCSSCLCCGCCCSSCQTFLNGVELPLQSSTHTVTNGLIGNGRALPLLKHWQRLSSVMTGTPLLFHDALTHSSPSCVHRWLRRRLDIAPSKFHATSCNAPARIVARPLPGDNP